MSLLNSSSPWNRREESPLHTRGFQIRGVDLPDTVRRAVASRNWAELDRRIAIETLPGGQLFEALRGFARFSSIEFIISIRSSLELPDEDGIWHDDGSRVLAFSLSLTENPAAIVGGHLEIRKRVGAVRTETLPTPPFGTMIVFATGVSGFEHRINRVRQGERIIIAGWCS